jgi:hypothetical protein
MTDIFGDLDYTLETLQDEKKLFLQTRNLLETESRRVEALRPIYMEFNGLYSKFQDSITNIVASNSELKDIKRMHSRGEIMQENFLFRSGQLRKKIAYSYAIITDNIFPKLREIAYQIPMAAAVPDEKKEEFEREKDTEIKKVEEEVKGKGVIEQIKPYLKRLIPALIKMAVRYTTGIPV